MFLFKTINELKTMDYDSIYKYFDEMNAWLFDYTHKVASLLESKEK